MGLESEIELGCDYQNVLHWSVSTDTLYKLFVGLLPLGMHVCARARSSLIRARRRADKIITRAQGFVSAEQFSQSSLVRIRRAPFGF